MTKKNIDYNLKIKLLKMSHLAEIIRTMYKRKLLKMQQKLHIDRSFRFVGLVRHFNIKPNGN